MQPKPTLVRQELKKVLIWKHQKAGNYDVVAFFVCCVHHWPPPPHHNHHYHRQHELGYLDRCIREVCTIRGREKDRRLHCNCYPEPRKLIPNKHFLGLFFFDAFWGFSQHFRLFFKEINTPPFYDTSCRFVKMSSVHIPYFILCAYSLANVILGRNCKWALDSTQCTFLNEFSQIWSRNDLFLGAGLQLGYVSRSDWYLGPGQFILQVHFRERCTFWKQVWIILRKLSSISVCQHPTNISLWSFLLSHNFCRTPFWGRLVILFTFVPPTVCVCGHYRGRECSLLK